MSGKKIFWSIAALTIAVAATAATLTATEAIKYRQKAMEEIRDQMKTLAAIAKSEQPFDAAVVNASAAKIAENLERATKLFPEGSDKGDARTWAKPEVWSDREQFDKFLASAHEAAVELQAVTDAAEFPAALGKLGNGCKSCHDSFRLPEN